MTGGTGLRYLREGIRADFLRSAAGIALTALPLSAVPLGSIAGVVFGGLAVLFAGYGVRTWVRLQLSVSMSEDGLYLTGPVTKNIHWDELSRLEMRYYAVRKNRAQGWMQATLASSGATVRLDSTLDGFPAIVRRAAAAAQNNGVTLSPTTLDNLRGFGVTDLDR